MTDDKWISVYIENPEISEFVLCFCVGDPPGHRCTGFRANGGWYIWTDVGKTYIEKTDPDYKITHWQPLPSPPKP